MNFMRMFVHLLCAAAQKWGPSGQLFPRAFDLLLLHSPHRGALKTGFYVSHMENLTNQVFIAENGKI